MPDDLIWDEVAKFVRSNDECKAKLSEALERCWERKLRQLMEPVRKPYERENRRTELASLYLIVLQRRAIELEVLHGMDYVPEPQLIEQILDAEERILESQRKPPQGTESLKAGREEFIRRGLEEAPLSEYARVMGWFGKPTEPFIFYEGKLESRRQIVWHTYAGDEARDIAAALQTQFKEASSEYDTLLCPIFDVLPDEGFTVQDRVTIQRTIEILSGSETPSKYTTAKLYEPEFAREVAREASALASTVAMMKEHRQIDDEDLRSTNATSRKVESQRRRSNADQETSSETVVDDAGPSQHPSSGAAEKTLSKMEQNIVDALRPDARLVTELLAKKTGYPSHSTFKSALAGMVRHGILVNLNDQKGRGYELSPQFRSSHPPDNSPDKSPD